MVGKKNFTAILINFLICSTSCLAITTPFKATVSNVETVDYFTVYELKNIRNNSIMLPATKAKYDKLMSSVIFKQSPGKAQLRDNHDLDRKYFRVTQWNIARGTGLKMVQNIFGDDSDLVKSNLREGLKEKDISEIENQIKILKETDIFLLNEVDIGIQRTGYKNVAEEIAKIINGGYAYAVEFLEIDPSLTNDPEVNSIRYKGLHGNAIISRFPMSNMRIVRLPEPYDWYQSEKDKLTAMEHVRRTSSKAVFEETIFTEVRKGSRLALLADVLLPNGETVTVVSLHLENRTMARFREQQLQVLLDAIKDISNPVILGADLNNFENSAEPTSFKKVMVRSLGDPQHILRITATCFNPYALIINPALLTVSIFHKYKDPTVFSIPVIKRNRAHKLFKMIKYFRFNDGLKFDFEGDDKYAVNGKTEVLSNSNERVYKGFADTFEFNRNYGIARFKIDWLFVKPSIDKDPKCLVKKVKHVYRHYECKHYFPAYGKTLKQLNHASKNGFISDHSPVTAEIIL